MTDEKKEVNYGRMLFAIYHKLETLTAKEIDDAWNNLTDEQRENYEQSALRIIGHWAETQQFSIESQIREVEAKAEQLAHDTVEAVSNGERTLADNRSGLLTQLRHRMHDAFNHIEHLSDATRKIQAPRRSEPLNF